MITSLRFSLLAASIAITFQLHAAPAGDLPLMPWPQQVDFPVARGSLTLNNALSITVSGDNLDGAIERWRQRISLQTGWQLQPLQAVSATPTIDIRIKEAVDPLPKPDSDESYQLSVTADGIKLTAGTRFGAMRGMETVLQLIHNGPNNTSIPYVVIKDVPRFPWRGLQLDSARHFMPVADILRQLDGMAAAKMNVFHWHLTDDQGWRFASTHYPKLQQLASDGQFYTREQMEQVVRYATSLGIRVVPEIDLPGHASALGVAYPELMSAPGPYQMERHWGVLKPLLNPASEASYTFIDTLIGEVTAIFPDSYLHIGGDEVNDSQWQASEAIQQFMKQHNLADTHALQTYFNQRLEKILARHQRQMMGWDEIYHPDLPKNILIQSWQGQDSLGAIAASGYKGILSTGFYLDQPQSTAYHYRNEVDPQRLNGVDQISDTDSAQSWSFDMPRLKGGAVEGSFTLVNNSSGWRGFIDFKGKSRRAVRDVQWLSPVRVTFTVDTWMGETRPVVTLENDKLSGYLLVGNVRYPATGQKLAGVPDGKQPVVPDKAQMSNILGGEAALWAENVISPLLDLKLWPRTFAVAERLWSAQDVSDVDNMYQRMQAIDAWSGVSVGLQQHTAAMVQMTRLAGTSDIMPLQILAQAVEPAQYYTRQHLKFQAGNYHHFEPLNRFADALGPESLQVRVVSGWVDKLISDPEDGNSAEALRHTFTRWQNNTPDVLALIDGNYTLKAMKPVAEDVGKLSTLGLRLINLVVHQGVLSSDETKTLQSQLDAAAQTRDEVVIALVYPLEKLLRAATK